MPRKIFELAKELDLKPLDLVEGLKAKGFAVRNHMSSLTDEEVDKFMQLRSEDEEKNAAGSKKKVKKKTTKKKKVVKKATKKTSKKTTKKTVKADEEDSEEKKVSKKKTTVIRRKVKSEKNIEAAPTPVVEEGQKLAEGSPVEVTGEEESNGLRVVSRPKISTPVEEPVKVEEGGPKKES